MPRQSRNLQAGYAYRITTRCNNRELKLSRRECREVFLYGIRKALDKYGFKLYALCIMSNHVRYLNRTDSTRRLAENYALSQWVYGDVFQSDAEADGILLGKAIFLRWVSGFGSGQDVEYFALHSRQPESGENAF